MHNDGEDLSVSERLSLILDSIANQDYSRCIDLCSNILHDDVVSISLRGNLQVIYCRALLKSSKFNDVIEYCTTLGQDLKGQEELKSLSLEWSYALYKLGRYSECCDRITKDLNDGINDEDLTKNVALKHLLAQTLYHLHETSRSIDTYRELLEASNNDEDCEILTNYIAALSANTSIPLTSDMIHAIEDLVEEELSGSRQNSFSFPYELAYNYATYQLLTSNSVSETKKALSLLAVAEDECRAEMDIENDKIVKAKNIMPIQANIAMGKLQCGDWNGAFRTCIELTSLSKELLKIDNTFNGAGSILTVENNLTVMEARKGTSSADLSQKLPDISMDMIGSKQTGPKRATPNQIRIILLNRALLLHKLSKTSEAKSVLACLRASINASFTDHGSKKKSKNVQAGIFDASPGSLAEKIFWEVKISLVEAEMNRNDDAFFNLESLIVQELGRSGISKTDEETLEFSLAEVKLYNCQKELQLHENRKKMSQSDIENKLISVLESLPQSITRRPAIIATLYALYNSTGDVEKMNSMLSLNQSNKKTVADFKLRLGYYEDSAEIYENILDTHKSGKSLISEEEVLGCRAGLIKALSYIDMNRAIKMSSEFDLNVTHDINGDDLELMDIPRLHNMKGHAGRIDTFRGDKTVKKKEKSMESVLRMRSKKREAYLAKLQGQGKYNPERPIKPDPERWIPKSQRSYNRRGRKVKDKFVGTQGGGTGVGAEKEAAKLDVAARLAARAEGKETFSQFSTAHLTAVSSTKDRGAPKIR